MVEPQEVAMLYDSLFSLDLPSRPGPPVHDGHAVENLLFTGRLRALYADCTLSSAAVLGRCYRAARDVGLNDVRVLTDADEVVQLPIRPTGPGARWPDRLPPEWTDQPCDFGMRATGRDRGLITVLQLRYTPRHRPECGALTGALRLLWDVAPATGRFGAALVSALGGDLSELQRRLDANGHAQLRTLLSHLRAAFEGAQSSSRGGGVLLHGYARRPNAFADLLAGFPAPCLEQLPVLERIAQIDRGRWPAVDSRGVRGRLVGERFVPVEEVSHAS